MDFGSLLLVSVLVFVLNEVVKRKLPKVWAAADLFISLGFGVAVVVAASQSDWADTTEFMGKKLQDMNAYSLVICGLLVGAAAVGLHKLALGDNSTVANIGQNKLSPESQALQDAAMAKAMSAQHPGSTLTSDQKAAIVPTDVPKQ